MTDPSSNRFVHQAYFGWSYSPRRLGLIACSSDSRNDRQRWKARLEEHIRLEGVPQAEKNCSALSYIDFGDEEVAVLRRVPSGYSEGRNDSHAFIGPADVLTPTVALGLEDWSMWLNDRPTNQWMVPLNASHLVNFTEGDLADRMRRPAMLAEPRIRAALSALLGSPNTGLSIIGCPRAERLPLVWALREASDDYLGRYTQVRHPWTFSTHEVRHEDAVENLPAIIFLPSSPEDTGYSSRVTVDLTPGRELSPGLNNELATELLGQFFHGVASSAPERVGAGVGATPPEPVGREMARTQAMPSLPQGMGAPGAVASDQGGVPDTSGYLESLRKATTAQEILSALEKLASSTSNPKQRAALRNALDVDAVNRITRVVTATVAKEVAPLLIAAVYGVQHTDLQQQDAMTHATTLIAGSESEDIARRVSEAARPRGEAKVVAAAYRRWENGRSPSAASPTRGGQHSATPLTKKKLDRKAVGIRAGAVLVAIVIAFLLGIIVGMPGESTENSSANPSPTPTNDAGPASTPDAPVVPPKSEALPAVGTVTLKQKPGSTEQVFSFVQIGKDYYPQAPCVRADGASSWQCTRMSAPPDASPAEPALVAYVIPTSQALEMQLLAAEGAPTTSRQGWHDEEPVKVG
jgi:hypothetical protein